MFRSKKYRAIFVLTLLVLAGVAATSSAGPRNLQILPKDISEQKLDSIMESYNKALGVNCAFCHDKSKQNADSLVFETDINPMKENARHMLRMTIDINTKYFNFQKDTRPEYMNVVHCNTCHRGEAFPGF